MALLDLIPRLEVNNMDESVDFYEALGFQVIQRIEDKFVVMQREGVAMMLSIRYTAHLHANTHLTGGLYIMCDNVDELWEQHKDRVKICFPIETVGGNVREFSIYDCNNYVLHFGQRLDQPTS